jgi:uncharacterized repeat protein (TIGR01451 family)
MRCATLITPNFSKCRNGKHACAAAVTVLRLLACAAALQASVIGSVAHAAPAGTAVYNTATLSFDMDGAGRIVPSNTVRLVVAERLDVVVTAHRPAALAAGDAEQGVAFEVINAGNGAESFDISGAVGGEGSKVLFLATDEDGNGVYDPKLDRKLIDPRLILAAGARSTVFVIVGGARAGTEVSLTARADTGSGAPGTAFDGKGDEGGDAIVGQTGATASAQVVLDIAAAEPSLTKSQAVSAPDGSAKPATGAIVTYTLDARFPARVDGVEIADRIPAGTTYVPGSLTLDGAALSDIADGDAGRFDSGAITVALGDIAGASAHSIRFQVKIQ